jgi:hypothetical protein
MKNLELRIGNTMPLLIYSDLEVVDFNLKTIAPSFMKYQGLTHPKTDPMGQFLIQNTVTGCATLFNRHLLIVGGNIPANAIVHDWWLALCAASFGYVDYIPLALVKYRQHSGNLIGAHGTFSPLKKEFWIKLKNYRYRINNCSLQASNLILIKANFSNVYAYKRIDSFLAIINSNFIDRFVLLKEIKLSRSNFFITVLINLRLLFLFKK